MLRQHAAGGADDLVDSISLETYKFKFEYENIDCAHCGYRMTDFYDLEGWPYGVDDFLSAFDQVASESCRKFVPIELVDAERFFDLLGIAQLSGEVDPETCGFHEASKPGPFLHSAFHLSSL